MTTKYLTGDYPGGYALSAAFTGLVIDQSASVEGSGVSASFNTTIQNYGSVNATGSGVYLGAGGTVTNGSATNTTALIEGSRGVVVRNGPATVANYGTIHGYTFPGISHNGIYLTAGGSVTNGSATDTAALIDGLNGVMVFGASATIANFGTIQGAGLFGVNMGGGGLGGGSVTNGSAADTTALIEGSGYGVAGFNGSATIANFGTIQGAGGSGVFLPTGGSVTNGSSGDTTALTSGYNGVRAGGAAATVTNFGAIKGTGAAGSGVNLSAGGSVTNGSAADTAALIAGNIGVQTSGVATVTNYGTISGTGGMAVLFSSASDVLVAEAASTFLGAVQGDGGTLDLASGTGTISNSGGTVVVSGSMPTTTFTNFGTVELTGGAQFTKALTGAYPGGYALSASYAGLIIEAAATVSGPGILALFETTIQNYGSVVATGVGSNGVDLDAGGLITNGSTTDTMAVLEGYHGGIQASGETAIVNFGTIQGTVGGVILVDDGTVTNGSASDTSALILGNYGVDVHGASATVVNYSTIEGATVGVALDVGGAVTNGSTADNTALITGYSGVETTGRGSTEGVATVFNFGTITGIGGSEFAAGVYLNGGGAVTNGSLADTQAMINGYRGIVSQFGPGTISNYGTIATIDASGFRQKSVGALLQSGGSVNNGSKYDITALIEGAGIGVMSASNHATVITNYGTIKGAAYFGTSLYDGTLTNGSAVDTTALIAGSGGVYFELFGGSATINNYGTIDGYSSHYSKAAYGVVVERPGTLIVSNGSNTDTAALIDGAIGGIVDRGALALVDNGGTIRGENEHGVYLTGGGTVTNGSGTDTTAQVEGRDSGVVARSISAKVNNYGAITGTSSAGVDLAAGGTVTNGSAGDATALIQGYTFGVDVSGATASVANYGTIQATYSDGVRLSAGGTVTNGSATETTARIAGGALGVYAQTQSATVANYGTIQGSEGVDLTAGGSVINGSAGDTTALIIGADGIGETGATATVTNYGTVQGQGDYGVVARSGGAITNGSSGDTSALLEGKRCGVFAQGASVAVANFGTIFVTGPGSHATTYSGIFLQAGGTVTNGSGSDNTAWIFAASDGVRALNTSATISNFGTIQGVIGYGAILYDGGTVTNGSATDATALIEGRGAGVDAGSGAAATIANYGTIGGNSKFGVVMGAGGTVTNGSATNAAALIAGLVGVETFGIATVTNFGTISGIGGTAVNFGSASESLVVEAGSVFDGAVLGDGGTLNLAGGVGAITDMTGGDVTVSGSMPTTTFTNFGTVRIGAGAEFILNGTGAIGAGGTSSLRDVGLFAVTGALSVSGTVSGTGTLAFTGGIETIASGASLTVSNWSLSGTAATTLNEALTYKGAFSEGAGATLTLTSGHSMAVTAATTLSGTVNGASTLKVSNATVSGLDIGGTSNFDDVGTATQTGTVTVGDATTKVATLTIGSGATYTIENNAGIGLGHAKASAIKNSGTLTDTGTGTTVVAIRVIDTGTMVAATGTLDFVGPITGAGAMSVNAGATLESDMSVASTISMTFNGAGAVLALKAPSKFAATINGFSSGETIDLLGKAATSAVLNGSDQLVITNGTKAVATLQLTAANAGETFAVASDGNGGSDITVSRGAAFVHPTPPATTPHRFIAAMAGMGAGSGGPVHSTVEAFQPARPMLSAPRMQLA